MNNSKREFSNVYMTVKIFDKGRNLNRSYDYADIDEIFNRTPFSQIPVPLNVYRNEYSGDVESRGNIMVGYIVGYNSETHEFDVMILEKFAKRIQEYVNPIVYPRVKIIGNKAVQILGFDICSASYYANIYK